MENQAEPMIGTIQCTSGRADQPNQKRHLGIEVSDFQFHRQQKHL